MTNKTKKFRRWLSDYITMKIAKIKNKEKCMEGWS